MTPFVLYDEFPLPDWFIKTFRKYTPRKVRAKKPRPTPPTLADLLRQAYGLRRKLKENPGLTHEALAAEQGLTPERVGQLLSLFKLAPAIHQHILAVKDLPIKEKQLFKLTAIERKEQPFVLLDWVRKAQAVQTVAKS